MYAWPVDLPAVSNREDFLLSASVVDDETGAFYNMAGVTGSGTFNSWTVTDGDIVTASNTSITIPQFPVGNQLLALALTVGTGLGILAGDPITIADATGNNTMSGYVLSYAAATGALVVQIGVSFQFEIRKIGPRSPGYGYGGYGPSYDCGGASGNAPEITASLGNGILITDVGYLQITIPESLFRKLHGGTHQVALTMTDSVNTRQLFVGSLPVIRGGVSN